VAGANAICVESYGGPSTPEYLTDGLDALPRNGNQLAPLVPVLALANVDASSLLTIVLNA
jgi:hypothetical protein